MTDTKKNLYWISYWIFFFLFYSAIIILAGAILFGFIAPVIGHFILPQYTIKELAYKGMSIGARYGGVWAGGTSIVFCFIRAAKLRKTKAS